MLTNKLEGSTITLPGKIKDFILTQTVTSLSPAYILLGKNGKILDYGGSIDMYGLNYLKKNDPIEKHIYFLEGIIPGSQKNLTLQCVKTGNGVSADIHILAETNNDWILFLDATKKEKDQLIFQQKGNELRLLKEKLSRILNKPLTDDFPEHSFDDLISVNGIVDALGIVIIECIYDSGFRLIGKTPPWFFNYFPEVNETESKVDTLYRLPFMENFLIDAEIFWTAKSGGRLKSGTFIEKNSSGEEAAFEVSALLAGRKKLLLIELLGNAHEERKALLQRARENTLIRGCLESEVCKRTEDIRKREKEIALRLVGAAESHDKDTGHHIRRIGHYSEAIAHNIGWSQTDSDDIFVAATMHDLGKIGIPDSILKKPAKLSVSEYEIMKTHTEIGAKILEGSDVPLLKMAREIALYHHERWDGQGYPMGLKGKLIPQSARIVAIADVYDALITHRVYKSAENEIRVIEIMKKELKGHFDPEIFECFLNLLPEFKKIRLKFSGDLLQ